MISSTSDKKCGQMSRQNDTKGLVVAAKEFLKICNKIE